MSTKKCECGSTDLILLRSYHKKICNSCKKEIQWDLDEGQEYLFASNRVKKPNKEEKN